MRVVVTLAERKNEKSENIPFDNVSRVTMGASVLFVNFYNGDLKTYWLSDYYYIAVDVIEEDCDEPRRNSTESIQEVC